MADDLLENGVEVRYRGPATLHRSDGADLQGRGGGVGGMLWEALEGAGWVGQVTSPHTTVAIRVGLPCVATHKHQPLSPMPRARHDGGWIDEDGVAWQQQVGPLSGRAVGPDFRILESEFAAHDRGQGDALLRAAATHAGWLGDDDGEIIELPDVRIAVSVARRNAHWEDPDRHPREPAPQEDQLESAGTMHDSELLVLAREVAARFGDPNPTLIQHARGTRFDLTRATGSTVFDDTPSCIFAMEGNFRWHHSRPANSDRQPFERDGSYRFLTVVIDAKTGKPMDHGASNSPRDLTALGNLITDHPPQTADSQDVIGP
jgi:hypothetical protein